MRHQALKAAYWVFAETVLRQLLLFAITVALARLLTPADFGLVAMLSVFVGVAAAIAEGGIGGALVQSQEPTDADKSTLFWFQLFLAAVLGSSLAAAGPALSALFQQPALTPIAIALGVNILIVSPFSIQSSLATKQLRFAAPVTASLIAQGVSGTAAIVAALHGAGPWAIVIQTLIASFLSTSLLWLWLPWRPSFIFSVESLRRYLAFSTYSTASAILAELENRVATLFLGRTFGPSETGLYQRAFSLQLLLSRLMSGVVTRVAFPAFAAIQSDRTRLLSAIREALFVNFSTSAPIMWAIALLAEPLLRVVFGPAWVGGAPALTALCTAAGFYALFAVSSKALRAVGKARLVFLFQLLRTVGMLAVVLLTVSHGLPTLAWAQSGFLIAALSANIASMHWLLGYRLAEQAQDLFAPCISGAAMALAVGLARESLSFLTGPAALFSLGVVAIGTYSFCFILLIWLVPSSASRSATRTVGLALGHRPLEKQAAE